MCGGREGGGGRGKRGDGSATGGVVWCEWIRCERAQSMSVCVRVWLLSEGGCGLRVKTRGEDEKQG